MSSMEEDAARFLKKIVKTLSAALLWMLVNMTVGIYLGWLFFHSVPTLGNYLFYGWMLLSLVALLWYLYKVWKEYI
jgi:hypothetical protein